MTSNCNPVHQSRRSWSRGAVRHDAKLLLIVEFSALPDVPSERSSRSSLLPSFLLAGRLVVLRCYVAAEFKGVVDCRCHGTCNNQPSKFGGVVADVGGSLSGDLMRRSLLVFGLRVVQGRSHIWLVAGCCYWKWHHQVVCCVVAKAHFTNG